ncbi:MAG: ELM1/GtrOC1 family putative glycosyltransferase [Kiritimatiellae bacterium]|jgi:mitochondrial fission protein ELM1|nr:ELM1/GtrOC1 family putative glycosyltransferase [Kiritimatiellia bacterium]
MKKILIVTDGKAGHENQSKALCEALGYSHDLLKVSYPFRLCKALSYAADKAGILTTSLFSAEKVHNDYEAVVCTGSTAFYPGKVIARQLKISVAALLFPSGYKLDFDCILAPAFDNPPDRENIIPIPINLTAVNTDFYEKGTSAFLKRHTPQKPAVAVIAGGPNSIASMTTAEMKVHLDRIFKATEGFERCVTTSRRTPAAVDELIDSYPFDYKLIYSRDQFNPIPAFVSLCERLFVTADSTGMISEAVTRGKAHVEVLMNLNNPHSKFARFIDGLVKEGCAHIFEGTLADANRKVSLESAIEKARKLLGLG